MFTKEEWELLYQCFNAVNIPGKFVEIAYSTKKKLEEEIERVTGEKYNDSVKAK